MLSLFSHFFISLFFFFISMDCIKIDAYILADPELQRPNELGMTQKN